MENSCLNKSDLSVYSKTVRELYQSNPNPGLEPKKHNAGQPHKAFKKKSKAEQQKWSSNKLGNLKQKKLDYLNKIQILRNPLTGRPLLSKKYETMPDVLSQWKTTAPKSIRRTQIAPLPRDSDVPFYSHQNNTIAPQKKPKKKTRNRLLKSRVELKKFTNYLQHLQSKNLLKANTSPKAPKGPSKHARKKSTKKKPLASQIKKSRANKKTRHKKKFLAKGESKIKFQGSKANLKKELLALKSPKQANRPTEPIETPKRANRARELMNQVWDSLETFSKDEMDDLINEINRCKTDQTIPTPSCSDSTRSESGTISSAEAPALCALRGSKGSPPPGTSCRGSKSRNLASTRTISTKSSRLATSSAKKSDFCTPKRASTALNGQRARTPSVRPISRARSPSP